MILGLKNTIIAVMITAAAGWAYSQYSFKEGIEIGKQQQIAIQSQTDEKVREMKDELKLAVVEGLKGIQVTNRTINNKAVREVVTKEVYRDCVVPEEGKNVVRQALEPR